MGPDQEKKGEEAKKKSPDEVGKEDSRRCRTGC